MPCDVHGNTIICSRGSRKSLGKCQECWVREATRLCDGPLPRGIVHRRSAVAGADKTCSKPLCTPCATTVGDHDYCSEHRDPEKRRLAL
jgi:hypothetical protein